MPASPSNTKPRGNHAERVPSTTLETGPRPRVDGQGRRLHRIFQPAADGKPRTYYVNGEVLGEVLTAPEPTDARPDAPRSVHVQRIDDAVEGVRANVRDAARAVLTWLAAVVEHDDLDADENLDEILRRCLRPSSDPKDVNYAALAQDIRRVTGVKLTAKRVQTAVRHLRKLHAPDDTQTTPQTSERNTKSPEKNRKQNDPLAAGLLALRERLADHFALIKTIAAAHDARAESTQHAPDAARRRELGIDLLAAVRAAAGRVIDRGFGEHIPEHTDLSALEGRFLGYLRDSLGAGVQGPGFGKDQSKFAETTRAAGQTPSHRPQTRQTQPSRLRDDFSALLLTLSHHPLTRDPSATPDETAVADVKLVLLGARIVAALLGPDALPGVLAHLNVLVVGRDLIDTDLYVAEMLRLAHAAEALHHDDATQTLLRWCRRQPEALNRKLPGAVRVASYARSNAATRLYERSFLGTIDANADAPVIPTMRSGVWGRGLGVREDESVFDAGQAPDPRPHPPTSYLQLADRVLADMEATDAGFTLTLTTRLLAHTTHTRLDPKRRDDALAYFRGLGEAKTLERLESLIKFDNGDEIVHATRRLAEAALPQLRHRLLVVS